MLVTSIPEAFTYSVAFTGAALLLFGGVKGHFTETNRIKSAMQSLLVGGSAAAGAFGLAHAFG
jgi:VIT1/CCC1 family predicted Fe2+/Mn2+ transporter